MRKLIKEAVREKMVEHIKKEYVGMCVTSKHFSFQIKDVTSNQYKIVLNLEHSTCGDGPRLVGVMQEIETYYAIEVIIDLIED